MTFSFVLSMALALPFACGDKDDGDEDDGTSDGGTMDAGTTDGGNTDGGNSDGGTSDGGTSDGGTTDGGTSDGGTSDGGTTVPDVEDCTDGVDNDDDGLIDCWDDECAGTDTCIEDCADGSDNDKDGLADCDDVDDCSEALACSADFFGEVTYVSSIDGVANCDVTVQLVGTDYVGDCNDCDFMFSMEAEIVRDDSAADCDYDSSFTYIPSGIRMQTYLAYWSEYVQAPPPVTYTDVLASGYGAVGYYGKYYYDYPGPYWSAFLAYTTPEGEVSPYGTVAFDGTTLDWTFYQAYSFAYEAAYVEYCGTYDSSYSEEGYGGDYSGSSELSCVDDLVDVWDFRADGTEVSITVDTVSDETAFDPFFYLVDEDSCWVEYADDSFDCTYPPPSYSCPSTTIKLPAGDYSVVVASFGSCAGKKTGEYSITLDQATNPFLELGHDDAERYVTQETITDVSGSGTVNLKR